MSRAPVRQRRHGPFHSGRCSDPPPPELVRGIAQFNQRQFFQQHETLESLWRGESDDVRYLYQGILLVGVAFYHLQRGNYHGAVTKLEQGMDLLRWFPPVCQGVAVDRLLADSRRALDALYALGPDRIWEFDPRLVPEVHWSTAGCQE